MTKVHKARIKKWVDALRSGKYKQAQSMLKNGDAYCCLGVACEVYRQSAKKGTWDGSAFHPTSRDTDYCDAELPEIVRDYFGFNGTDPALDNDPKRDTPLWATTANDRLEWSFKRIAKAVEKMYLTPNKKERSK